MVLMVIIAQYSAVTYLEIIHATERMTSSARVYTNSNQRNSQEHPPIHLITDLQYIYSAKSNIAP